MQALIVMYAIRELSELCGMDSLGLDMVIVRTGSILRGDSIMHGHQAPALSLGFEEMDLRNSFFMLLP